MSKLGHIVYLVVIGILVVSIAALVFRKPESPDQTGGTGQPTPIAVLPFHPSSQEEHSVRFAEGVTNSIVNALAEVPTLKVASRSSTEAFSDSKLDFSEIGEGLAVSRILEGSVRLDQGSVRVTAQLVDVATGAHLWSETYNRDGANLEAVAAEIAEQVAYSGHDWR